MASMDDAAAAFVAVAATEGHEAALPLSTYAVDTTVHMAVPLGTVAEFCNSDKAHRVSLRDVEAAVKTAVKERYGDRADMNTGEVMVTRVAVENASLNLPMPIAVSFCSNESGMPEPVVDYACSTTCGSGGKSEEHEPMADEQPQAHFVVQAGESTSEVVYDVNADDMHESAAKTAFVPLRQVANHKDFTVDVAATSGRTEGTVYRVTPGTATAAFTRHMRQETEAAVRGGRVPPEDVTVYGLKTHNWYAAVSDPGSLSDERCGASHYHMTGEVATDIVNATGRTTLNKFSARITTLDGKRFEKHLQNMRMSMKLKGVDVYGEDFQDMPVILSGALKLRVIPMGPHMRKLESVLMEE